MKKGLLAGIIIAGSALLIGAGALGYFKYKSIQEEKARIAYEAEQQRLLEIANEDYQKFISESEVFYSNTFFNGENISALTPEEVVSRFDVSSKPFTIYIEGTDYAESVDYSFFGVDKASFEAYINDAYANREFSFDEYLSSRNREELTYDFSSHIDSDKIKELEVFQYIEENAIPSQDAFVSIDNATGDVVVTPAVKGTDMDPAAVVDAIEEALKNSESEITISTDDCGVYVVSEDDPSILAAVEKLSSMRDKEITIYLCGEATTLKGEKLWKILSSENDGVNTKALYNYIDGLKASYDSAYFDRTFTTSLGDTITVPHGNYGWILDRDKTAAAVKDAIVNNKASAEASYARYGQCPISQEMPNTYIEVSISAQHIWVYKDGECILSDDVTTGEVSTNNPHTITNRGIFKLTYKTTNVTLRGADYEEPVSYWMPFDGGIGFHDATWREDWEFGGENYIGNGSHGCVNMRLNSAAALYAFIEESTPIIVW